MSQTEHAQIAAVTSTLPATEAGATSCHGDVAVGHRGPGDVTLSPSVELTSPPWSVSHPVFLHIAIPYFWCSTLHPVLLSFIQHHKAQGRRVDECGVQCSTLVFCAPSLWCNGVGAGIPHSPIFPCKYIPDQWTTECSAPIAAAAEVALFIDRLHYVSKYWSKSAFIIYLGKLSGSSLSALSTNLWTVRFLFEERIYWCTVVKLLLHYRKNNQLVLSIWLCASPPNQAKACMSGWWDKGDGVWLDATKRRKYF